MAAQTLKPLELLALLVSGGHTELVYVSEAEDYKVLGNGIVRLVRPMIRSAVSWKRLSAGREIDELAHRGSRI